MHGAQLGRRFRGWVLLGGWIKVLVGLIARETLVEMVKARKKRMLEELVPKYE